MAFNADKITTLDDIKFEMTEKMTTYMAKYSDAEQYPVCLPELGLRQYGSCVEAINGANKPAREVDMAHWLEKMTNTIVQRAKCESETLMLAYHHFLLECMTACLHNKC